MSGKKSRQYRAAAYAYASHNGVFAKGQKDIQASLPWWRRILDAILPVFTRKPRAAEDRMLSWWYKRTLKHLARGYAAYVNDPDRAAFERAKRKIAKRRSA